MTEEPPRPGIDPISRRSLLRGGAAAALAVLLPFDSVGCNAAGLATRARRRRGVAANIRVSHDRYGVHIEPSLAANPRNPRQLLVACQVSPTPNPEFIATYLSFDGGMSWENGGLPPKPSTAPDGDDITVAFDANGRGYICATRAGHVNNANPANPNSDRAVYVWRTDDGGRSFSAPMTLTQGQYCDHPWLAAGPGETASGRDVYGAWGAGASTPHSISGAQPTAGRASNRRAGSCRRPTSPRSWPRGPRSPRTRGPDQRSLRLDERAGPVRRRYRPGHRRLLD